MNDVLSDRPEGEHRGKKDRVAVKLSTAALTGPSRSRPDLNASITRAVVDPLSANCSSVPASTQTNPAFRVFVGGVGFPHAHMRSQRRTKGVD